MRTIDFIGANFGLGGSIEGCEYASQKLRSLGLISQIMQYGYRIDDKGDVAKSPYISKSKTAIDNVHYLCEVVQFSTLLKQSILQSYQNNHTALVIGGDHSIAIGSLSATLQTDSNAAVIWFDAHTDINTEATSPSHNAHGMPLAAMLHLCTSSLSKVASIPIKSTNIFYIGVRSIDYGERQIIQQYGIHTYTIQDIRNRGMQHILQEINYHIQQQHIKTLHLSFDIDSIDPTIAPATGVPVPNGITLQQLDIFCKWLPLDSIRVIDFVEYNPLLDDNNTTGKFCCQTICKILSNNRL